MTDIVHQPPIEVLEDKAALSQWLSDSSAGINYVGAVITDIDFSDLDLFSAEFGNSTLQNVSFRKSYLEAAKFGRARIIGGDLSGADLTQAVFSDAVLQDVLLDDVFASNTFFVKADLAGASFVNLIAPDANFEHAKLKDASLRNARLSGSNLGWADLSGCDLRGTNLSDTTLTNARFGGARIDSKTILDGVVFGEDHPALNDGSESIRPPPTQWLVNWARVRFASRIPLFGLSYIVLALSVLLATAIGWLNNTHVITQLAYPIPVPERLQLTIWASVLLAFGSTWYELACPERVKEFSEQEWVDQLKRPRLLYIYENLKRRFSVWPVAILLGVGGVLATYLFVDRVATALAVIL